MKKSLRQLHRPLVWAVSYFILGIIGGTIWTNGLYSSFFIWIFIALLFNFFLVYYTKRGSYMCFILFMCMGSFIIVSHPVYTERLIENTQVTLRGTVISKAKTNFNETLILDKVSRIENKQHISLKSKIKLISSQQDTFNIGEELLIQGEIEDLPKMYNPSDFDYGLYLKSQGIVNEVKLQKVIKRWPNKKWYYQLRDLLNKQIKSIFKGRDDGIVHALITGEDLYLEPDTEELYRKLGIAHVLAISGLHMSIISGLLWWALGFTGLDYNMRNRISLVGIWSYSFLAGMSVSVMRASIMITVMLIVRSLWEEEDLLVSLALAAFIILIGNPFQLYQVGFQLSFSALLGVAFYQSLYRFLKHTYKYPRRKLAYIKGILPSLSITLFITPVLAYHFYEVPTLSLLLNIGIIPLFTMLMPLIFITIIISFINPLISMLLSSSILGLLELVKSIGGYLAMLPFASFITGRPSLLQLACYYGCMVLVIAGIKGLWNRRVSYYLAGMMGFLVLVGSMQEREILEITQLYVGQGDCAIATTPYGKVILLDSGTKQSGKKVESYLKYKGKRQVDLAVISHPHEDHMGGLFYLIESGYKVKQIIWNVADGVEDRQVADFKALCGEKNIPIHTVYGGDQVSLGEVKLQVIAPSREEVYDDANEDALVCLLKYGEFEELFTGDIGIDTEEKITSKLKDIEVLKVAHHGSRYSSSTKFLEKVGAEYGMISAGVKNLYGHPHALALERLEDQDMEIMRTDIQGALFIRTDGRQYTVQSQIQEE